MARMQEEARRVTHDRCFRSSRKWPYRPSPNSGTGRKMMRPLGSMSRLNTWYTPPIRRFPAKQERRVSTRTAWGLPPSTHRVEARAARAINETSSVHLQGTSGNEDDAPGTARCRSLHTGELPGGARDASARARIGVVGSRRAWDESGRSRAARGTRRT